MGRHRGTTKRTSDKVCEICGAGIAQKAIICDNCRNKLKITRKMRQMILDTVERTHNQRSRLKNPKPSNNKTKLISVNIPLDKLERMRAVYNVQHNTCYTYGQFVSMLHLGKINLKECLKECRF